MTLEDHLGDIMRKARVGAGITIEAAARAAGVDLEQWGLYEERGQSAVRPDYMHVGELLDLDGAKLEGVARGWMPLAPDLSRWRELYPIRTSGGGMDVNSFLIWDEVTREAAFFDTGFEAGPLFGVVEKNELQPKHLFITHSHHDHVAALGEIRQRYPKIKLHSSSKHAPLDQRNRLQDFIHLGSLRITYRETPGHAEDGATYVIGMFPDDAPNVAVVGDAIFAGSIGGAPSALALAKQKIREQIFSLPDSTLICPGHGPLTTVEEEKRHNPFFK